MEYVEQLASPQLSAKQNLKTLAQTVVCMILGMLFFYSGLLKLSQPTDFLSAVYGYKLVSRDLGIIVALSIPALEVVVGICLVVGLATRGAALLAALLSGVFAVVIGWALYHELNIACGCFGSASYTPASWSKLMLSLTLLLVTSLLAAWTMRAVSHF